MKAQGRLARQWQLLSAISSTRAGLTTAQLMEATQQSKANLHRDLRVLTEAGLPLSTERGRVRLLTEKELPALGFSALQISSLHLARAQLAPLAGAGFVGELDSLLVKLRPLEAQSAFHFAASGKLVAAPQILKTIERAQRYRRRVAIDYRAASHGGTTTHVHIEPLVFNVSDGDPYVLGYCVERKAERTYKLSRITRAELTEEPSTYKPLRPPTEAFAHAVKAWSGEPQAIRLRLDANVAWLANEYPLPGQKVTTQPDGSVVIEARVAGLVEARGWILAWGGAAEALEPAELREAMRLELSKALRKYNEPGLAKAAKVTKAKSAGRRESSLKDRETRVG